MKKKYIASPMFIVRQLSNEVILTSPQEDNFGQIHKEWFKGGE